jgi:hypothetical protein
MWSKYIASFLASVTVILLIGIIKAAEAGEAIIAIDFSETFDIFEWLIEEWGELAFHNYVCKCNVMLLMYMNNLWNNLWNKFAR